MLLNAFPDHRMANYSWRLQTVTSGRLLLKNERQFRSARSYEVVSYKFRNFKLICPLPCENDLLEYRQQQDHMQVLVGWVGTSSKTKHNALGHVI